ncbi:maltose phosphorylase [Vibrio sp. JCM 19052]|nr:maltose phosphorylase [Vibrio sp. JCM 19052]
MNITIGGSDFDQLAIRFAQYQLNIFTPMHDSRFGIGAKGLSGEGYKGHSFWDTEVFMLPFFIYTMPEVARSYLSTALRR